MGVKIMPSTFCVLCSAKMTVKPIKINNPNYTPICGHCRFNAVIPEEYRCKGISTTTGERCKTWRKHNEGSDYCQNHRELIV